MFRVMIASWAGYEMNGDCWGKRLVWSTWSSYDTEEEALLEQQRLVAGGNTTTVIPQEDYDYFCMCHRIA